MTTDTKPAALPLHGNARQPLAGRRILVGRTRKQAGTLSSALRALGATVLEIPFIEIRPPRSFRSLDDSLRRHREYDWLILTSANGVSALIKRLCKLRLDAATLAHLKIAAIGPATRAALENDGFAVAVMPKEYVAEAVVASLKNEVNGKRVLLVRAKVARDVIPAQLREAGAQVDVREAYETVVPKSSRERLLAALNHETSRPDVIPFTSSSTAKNFVQLVGANAVAAGILEGISLASIGPVTTSTLQELNLPVHIQAAEYSIPGLIDALVRHFSP